MTGESTEIHLEELREIEAIRKRQAEEDPWAENERSAKQRIRDDAQRPLGENLAAALSLSAFAIELRDSFQRTLARKNA